MQIEKKYVFAALVFLSTIIFVFFLNASSFSLSKALFLSNAAETARIIFSPNFLLALIFFPLPFTFAAIAAKQTEKKTAQIYCTIAAAIAVLLSLALFNTVSEHIIIFVFFVICFPLIIESADLSFKELKRFITPRAVSGAIKKADLLLALALFIVCSTTVMNNPAYITDFEKALFSGASSSSSGIDLSDLSTSLVIQTQKQSLQTIISTPTFEKLRTKSDVDVNAFVAEIDSLSANIDSPAYKQQVKEQIQKNQSQLFQGTDNNTIETIKKQFPIFNTLENYLWLLFAITAVSIFLPILSLIVAPLSMLYSIIIDKLYP